MGSSCIGRCDVFIKRVIILLDVELHVLVTRDSLWGFKPEDDVRADYTIFNTPM